MKPKITIIGNSAGVILPRELPGCLRLEKDDELFALETPTASCPPPTAHPGLAGGSGRGSQRWVTPTLPSLPLVGKADGSTLEAGNCAPDMPLQLRAVDDVIDEPSSQAIQSCGVPSIPKPSMPATPVASNPASALNCRPRSA